MRNIDKYIADFWSRYCPYRYEEVKAAIELIVENDIVGKNTTPTQKLRRIMDDFIKKVNSKSDLKITEEVLDLCYCVLDYIFEEARKEIKDLFDIDIQDFNFCVQAKEKDSSFICSYEHARMLEDKIKETGFANYLNKKTNYFLKKCGIKL